MIPIHSTIRSVAVVLAVSFSAGACSSIPDAASPAHWYRSTVDYFSADDKEKDKSRRPAEKRKAAQPATGGLNDEAKPAAPAAEEKPAPAAKEKPATLASESTSASEVSERIARPSNRGLLADPTGPRTRYAPAISRQAEDSGVPPSRAQAATASVPGAAEAPPPVSAPRAPVSAATPPAPASEPRPAPAPAPVREAAPRPAPAVEPPVAQPQVAEARRSPPPRNLAVIEAPANKSESAPVAPAEPERKPVSVDEAYRASLARQNQLPNAPGNGRADNSGTMIISSEGIETARRVPSALTAESADSETDSAAGGKSLGRFLDKTPGKTATGGKLVRVATIQFADGSAKLDAEARAIVAQVAKLQREKGGAVRVVGHASMRTRPMDPDRHGQVNEKISAARADAVVRQLTRLGVKSSAVAADALGDSDPVFFEVMQTGEAGNRRAEIYMEF